MKAKAQKGKKKEGLQAFFSKTEKVGFEPTCPERDKLISSQPRYDHFDTSPCVVPDYFT